MGFDFEAQREANIARNMAMLRQLGLDTFKNEVVMSAAKHAPKTKKQQQKPRKRARSNEENLDGDEKAEKKPRKTPVVTADTPSGGPRRSGRNAGKTVDYRGDGDNLKRNDGPRLVSEKARTHEQSEEKESMNRKHDPKVYGSIPGVEIGAWWASRRECSIDAIHAPWVAGVAVGPEGAYSVALSGGYEDDLDLGEAFTYTGAGGRDLKGTKDKPKNLRTGPQCYDQDFENASNKALLRSVETKNPIRVIRGYKLHSKYAPLDGYRYDGLYTVEQATREVGLNPGGHLVCKFVFKRLPGQPPLPVYEDREAAKGNDADSNAASEAEDQEDDKADKSE